MAEQENEYYADGEIASWSDVIYYCFHNLKENFVSIVVHFAIFTAFSCVFFSGIIVLASSLQVLGTCDVSVLLNNVSNPLSALAAGVLASALFQSSFVVNNVVIYAMVVSGLNVEHGIYLAMGSNIGCTVTSNVVSLFHITDKNMLERAVAGASVNTIYYFLAALVFFPLERGSGVFLAFAKGVAPNTLDMNYQWEGLLDVIITPFTNLLLIPNNPLIQSLVQGNLGSCEASYPVSCENGDESFSACSTGLIACDAETDVCPIFFNENATKGRDQIFGSLALIISIIAIALSALMMTRMVNKMLINNPVEVIAKLTTQNDYIIMLLSSSVGLLLANPSITEASVMPFVATGIVEIEQMLPWCIGSNLGASITNMLVAWTLGNRTYLQVTLANVCFNVCSTILWYPIPYLRECPLHGALIVGIMTRTWRTVCIGYIVLSFIVVPFVLLGLGKMINDDSKGTIGLGWFVLLTIGMVGFYFMYSWFHFNGRERFIAFFERPPDDSSDDGRGGFFGGNKSASFDDDFSDTSDLSSIGFEEAKPKKRKPSSRKVIETMRPKTFTPPQQRKRLIKNNTAVQEENCGCCADNCMS